MKRFNIFDGELDEERTEPAGFRWRAARLGHRLGAEKVGATVYELEPGERSFPYHYEYGAEEWLLVIAGRPTLRVTDGEHELRAGDVVCFPDGPDGAHLVRNDSDEPVRILVASTKDQPQLAVYPDSGKIGVWPGNDADGPQLVRRDAAVYDWDGEL